MGVNTQKCIITLVWVSAIIFINVGCTATARPSVATKTKSGDGLDNHVTTQCRLTRYPTLCVQTLQHLASPIHPDPDYLGALINTSISEMKLPDSNFEVLSYHFISPEAHEARTAMDYCHELMGMAVKRLKQAQEALQKSPENHKEDIQTWLSAVLTFQETCKDSVERHIPSNVYMAEIHKRMGYLSELNSNPLALANRITGVPKPRPAGRRVLQLERESAFPSWVSIKDRKLLQSKGTVGIRANAVVAKDGTGNFETVSEAIKAAGGGRFVIYVKAGTYNEKINTNKDDITLIGDGKYSTIIYGSSSVGGGSSLQGSSTFTVSGDRFIARDIGFHNTAGNGAEQAVALTVASDHAVFYRCSIAGYQDTLYALSLRQFYRECDIHGTIDFIFGNAAAVFQSCNLVLRRPGHGAYDVILANGRSDPGQNTGFSVQNCRITVGADYSGNSGSYLGRPWREYSRAVVMQSTIDGVIASRGWVEWPGAGGSTYKSLYFAEYGNMGAGGGTSGRVRWPGLHVLGTAEAEKFTVGNFIGGSSWLPSTGVTFDSGL